MQPTLSSFPTNRARLGEYWSALRASWVWSVVLAPFGITRLLWVLAAAFAQGVFQPNPTYLKYVQQGGQLTRIFLLDIFARWDSRFYLSVIKSGYSAMTDYSNQYSNVAFLPLYPYLVKSIGWLGLKVPDAVYLAIGELLSNLCFLAAMILVYRLATRHLGLSETAVKRGLALWFVFPASFIFSCFYTESLFLLLTVLGFTAAFERRWWLVGVTSALVMLTRVQGALVVAALGWLYMESRGWRLRDIRLDAAWFGLAPAALLAHLAYIYTITGHFFAPIEAQVAWNRNKYGLLEGLRYQLSGPTLDVYKIDALMMLFFIACGVWMLWKRVDADARLSWKAFGLYTIFMSFMPAMTGMVYSGTRYIAVIFPVFLLLGEKLERRDGYNLLWAVWFALQILYFAGWANYYWVA